MGKSLRSLFALGAIVAVGSGAQAANITAKAEYLPDYFSAYAPATALDMVRRIPGFTIELGDQDLRGFGQGAGNVLVNGSRPTSKSDTLETILARIPANRVARIELGAGDLFGAGYSGKPQVLNIALVETRGASGTITGTARRSYDGSVSPQGSVSALLRAGSSSFNVSAGYDNQRFSEEGGDIVTRLSDEVQLELRDKVNDMHDRQPFLAGSWSLSGGEYRAAHLNIRIARRRFDLLQTSRSHFPSGDTREDELVQDYERGEFEIGGDVTRPLSGGGIKFIALATRRDRDDVDISRIAIETDQSTGFRQKLKYRQDERVARTVWSHAGISGWKLEIGGEGAFNRLRSDVSLMRINADGTYDPIVLPLARAVVSEYRGELFASAGRPLSSNVRIDFGVAYERSRLLVAGDAEAERNLGFLKPRSSLDWRPNKQWHFQLSLARTVAQLNFEDFISAAELASDRVSGGNADLVPQRALEVLATAEKKILGDGVARVELGAHQVSSVQDRVPVGDGLDAPGNLGSGRRLFLNGALDLPLAPLGVKGGRLSLQGSLQDSVVEDPYTFKKRSFTGSSNWAFGAEFRQDLGSVAWGLNVTGIPARTYYWRGEIDRSGATSAYVTGFVDYRLSPQTTLTFGLDNILEGQGARDRLFFDGDRGSGQPSSTEHRERNRHVQAYMTLKRGF